MSTKYSGQRLLGLSVHCAAAASRVAAAADLQVEQLDGLQGEFVESIIVREIVDLWPTPLT